MENNAIYDRIEDLMAKADEIKLAVDEFGEMLEDIQTFTNETNVVVKDILSGRQLSEWIADLETSGTASATYADSDRMNALIADTDACKNIKIAQYLLDWAVAHNQTGTYLGACVGNVSGVTWSSLTTPTQVCGNSSAFSAAANNDTAFNAMLGNASCKSAMYNGYATTENVIRSSAVALAALRAKQSTSWQGSGGNEYIAFNNLGKAFILGNNQKYKNASVTRPGGGYITENDTTAINRFGSQVTINLPYSGVNTMLSYVDFS